MIYLNIQNSNIRRIDELGRIVIPKDIRKKLRIKDNEPLEIYIENEEIIIKKYSALPDIKEYIDLLIDIGNRITKNKYIVTNRTHIIASSDKTIENQSISQCLESYCLTGSEINNDKTELAVTKGLIINAYINLVPILIDGDRGGILIEYNEQNKLENSSVLKIYKNLIEKNFSN